MKKNKIYQIQNNHTLMTQIKSNYINANLGEFPTVEKIYQNLGLSPHEPLPLDEVKAIAKKENWVAQRESQLEDLSPYSPTEMRLLIKHRTNESLIHLQNLIKVVARLDIQYLQSGQVLSLDGSKVLRDYDYDPKNISVLMFAMNQIFQSSTLSEKYFSNQAVSSEVATNHITASQVQLVSRLSAMTLDELSAEVSQLDQLAALLSESNVGDIKTLNSRIG